MNKITYRILEKGEEILETDEMLDCGNDNYNNEGVWIKVPKHIVGRRASDPRYPAHTIFRRKEKMYKLFLFLKMLFCRHKRIVTILCSSAEDSSCWQERRCIDCNFIIDEDTV